MKGTADSNDPASEVEDDIAVDAEATGEESPDEAPELQLSELEQAILERDEAKGLSMRAQADYQNLRRRTQADIDAAVLRAKSEVLGEAITVLDYLDMALASPVTSEDGKNLKIGIEMTRAQLQGLFDRLNVKPIEAAGEFDPTLHQAVSTVESTEHEPGTIVEVVRGGWLMGETVVRYAQVRVAAAPEAEADDAGSDGSPSDEARSDETEASSEAAAE